MLFVQKNRVIGEGRDAPGSIAPEEPQDPAAYSTAVKTVLESAVELSTAIQTNAPNEPAFHRAKELSKQWAQVRRAPGYDPLTHDGFIISFSKAFTTLKSGELIQQHLEKLETADPEKTEEASQTEVVFALMALHGAETGDALRAETGMDWDALTSRTNLEQMIQFSRTRAVALIEDSQKAFKALP